MNASTAKIIGIVLIVLLAAGFLKFLVAVPFGIIDGVFHGHRWNWSHGDGWWLWPAAGFGGLLALLFVAVAIWVLIWVYKDAQSRGMNGVLWVILVFFLHILGLIVYLLVRSGYPVRKPETRPAAPPAPAAPTPPAAPTAPPAPEPTAPPTPPPAAPPQPSQAFPACTKCGNPVHTGWVACPHCGEKL